MNKIEAFMCEFCGKVYTNPKTCKAHEKKCYYNPNTKSCASCEHLGLEKKYIRPNEYFEIQVCKVGIAVNDNCLRSDCSLYSERKEGLEEVIMSLEMPNCRTEASWQSFVCSSLRALADNKLT